MKVGSIVECVKTIGETVYSVQNEIVLPQKGKIYTIREVRNNAKSEFKGDHGRCAGVYILLEEIINPKPAPFYSEVGFNIELFREIQFPPDLEAEIQEMLTEPILIEA